MFIEPMGRQTELSALACAMFHNTNRSRTAAPLKVEQLIGKTYHYVRQQSPEEITARLNACFGLAEANG